MIKSRGERAFDIINVLLMILLAVIFIYPALLIICTSFTSATAITKNGYSILIREFSLSSYEYIFGMNDSLFLRSLLNSAFVTVVSTVLNVMTTSLYAYALTRRQLHFKKLFTIFLIIPMLFAGGTIPYYLIINSLHLMNSHFAIILPSAVSAWYIILVKNFMGGLPDSLNEAAQIEGASNVQVLFKVTLPLAFPIIATIILYVAVATWNDWFQASLFLDSQHKNLWTVQQLVRQIQEAYESILGKDTDLNAEGIKCATVVISTLPIVIVYPFLQKYFIGGVLVGGVKE